MQVPEGMSASFLTVSYFLTAHISAIGHRNIQRQGPVLLPCLFPVRACRYTDPLSVLQYFLTVARERRMTIHIQRRLRWSQAFPTSKETSTRRRVGKLLLHCQVLLKLVCYATLLCSTHKQFWICNNEFSFACAKFSALHSWQLLEPDNEHNVTYNFALNNSNLQ